MPGKPDESLIIQKIEAGEMPPPDLQYDYAVRNATDAEVATLREWVADERRPPRKRMQLSIRHDT